MIQYQLFPCSRGITDKMQDVIDCFVMKQVDIDSKTHDTLESNDVLAFVSVDLEKLGFKVERSKKRRQN